MSTTDSKKPAPDFINPEGVKWWKNETLTNYAKGEWGGIRLDDAAAYETEHPNGSRRFVLIRGGNIIIEATSYPEFSAKVDVLKFQEKTKSLGDLTTNRLTKKMGKFF